MFSLQIFLFERYQIHHSIWISMYYGRPAVLQRMRVAAYNIWL